MTKMNERILIVVLLLMPLIDGIPSNSFYLIDLSQDLSTNETYCSNLLTNDQTYRIPPRCHHHLLCNPSHCDDQSFRCIKIREALCCLHDYLAKTCQNDNFLQIKDRFRSVYFQISIEHGYCEINLERIEKSDQTYCLATNDELTSTTSSSSRRSTLKYFHRRLSTLRPIRNRHRLANRQNFSSAVHLDFLPPVMVIEQNSSSFSAKTSFDFATILTLSLVWLF